MRRVIIGALTALACQTLLPQLPTQAGILTSPYYHHIIPRSGQDNCRVLDSFTIHGHRISLFVKDRAHQFGVITKALGTVPSTKNSVMTVQMIERRPFTARRSVADDGLIFQYWEQHVSSKPFVVLFGYASDPKVVQVRLKMQSGERPLKLVGGRYFYDAYNPLTDRVLGVQGLGRDGTVLRTWNDTSVYPARRTWMSFFVQTYPYVVS